MISTFSKVFEKLSEKINDHMQSNFSKHLTGFRKKLQHAKCSTGYTVIGKWKVILNKKLKVGALFMDFQKYLIPLMTLYCWQN